MKRLLLLTLLMALLLTACGPKPAAPAEQKSETPPVEAASQDAGSILLPDRPAEQELTFMLEGQEETVPAELYVGGDWSLYIPAEGWRLDERETEDGVPETVWESTDNDDAELWVLSLGQRTLAEAQTWLQREEDDFVFQGDKQGGLWGTDAEDHQQMEVRFHEGSGALYAVVWTYPESTAEGFGTRLSVMADTFEAL